MKLSTLVVSSSLSDGKKVYFCTENNKAVYKQIKENPNVSFCVHKPDFSYVLSISGKVTFTNDINLKEKALNEYPALKEIFKIPIIGVIEAGARTAINTTKSNEIGVIGTKATIKSEKYIEEIKLFNPKVKVFQKACPLFVPAVEEGILSGKLVNQIIKTYLDDFEEKIDTLILGCTHYPLLKEAISKIYPNIKIVDPAKETALDLKEILKENKFLKNDAQKNEEVKYYVTDGKEKFKEIGIMFLEENIPTVELIKL